MPDNQHIKVYSFHQYKIKRLFNETQKTQAARARYN
jgi:hypothetical protein